MYEDILKKITILNNKIDELAEAGETKSRAEANYRVALASFMAQEIALGRKVTVLGDLARGQKNIASLRLNRDMKQVIYDSIQERIYAIKTEIRLLETMLKLEYNRGD